MPINKKNNEKKDAAVAILTSVAEKMGKRRKRFEQLPKEVQKKILSSKKP